jgi:glutamine amidotransferase
LIKKSEDLELAIIRYNAGNIRSVLFALERIGAQAVVTEDPERIRAAGKVIFPGVGEASSAMRYLKERGLDTLITGLRQPVLGICLGMQLMCRHSEENDTGCLGIFPCEVKRFDAGETPLKVPHMGWNTVHSLKGSLFGQVPEDAYCYFVHSYYATRCEHTVAVTEHAQAFSSALQKDNFYGVQFHPEKSAAVGERILRNFLSL